MGIDVGEMQGIMLGEEKTSVETECITHHILHIICVYYIRIFLIHGQIDTHMCTWVYIWLCAHIYIL